MNLSRFALLYCFATKASALVKSPIIVEDVSDPAPFPSDPIILPPPSGGGSSCTCQSDYDCQKPVCIFDPYSHIGTCGSGSSNPTLRRPIIADSGASCTCQSDYDCQKPVCVFNPYSQVGTCGGPSVPTRAPTRFPTLRPVSNECCKEPRIVPTKCEVDILIKMLEVAISSDPKAAAQWLRLSFHDAGTFDVATDEGGANGCLMTDLLFRAQPENGFLDIPINTLAAVKSAWEAHPGTCITISAADIIQFAGLFSSLRQVPPAGIDSAKRDTLMKFEWGRPDETNCDVAWVDNLPGFRVTPPHLTGNIPLRCLNAGGEIKKKMMERNGFTAEEAVALIGAHTIGLTRNSFHVSNPWVTNGHDTATRSGPVFDNAYHHFLDTAIVANTAVEFSTNIDPFDVVFPDWFLDTDDNLSHLDTDVTLAFPSQDLTIHPHYHTFTAAFASDNDLFLNVFFKSLDKMSKLGVHEFLSPATECTPCDVGGGLSVDVVVDLVSDLGTAKADGELQLSLRKESEALTALREADTVPLTEKDILSVDESLAGIMDIQPVSKTTTSNEDFLQ